MSKRLTQFQADEARRRYALGETQTSIAKEFGVSPSAISMIIGGKYHTGEKVRLSDEEKRRRKKSGRMLAEYGVTIEEWESMLDKASRRCQVCGDHEDDQPAHHRSGEKFLVLDHDHRTGKPRGVLCANCNKAIGFARDSVEILDKIKEYLIMYEDKHGKAY